MEGTNAFASETHPNAGHIIRVARAFDYPLSDVSRRNLSQLASSGVRKSTALAKLTAREREVAHLLAKRRTSKEIAEALGVTFATARRHTERVLAKLGLNSRRAVEKYFDDG